MHSGARRFPMRRRALPFLLVLLPLCIATTAVAHPLAPALFSVHEHSDGKVDVLVRESRWRPGPESLTPQLPSHCRLGPASPAVSDAVSITRAWSAQCSPPGLDGASLGMHGFAASPTNVVLRLELADGRILHAVLDTAHPRFTVAANAGAIGVSLDYARLGLEHIAYGVDHLLFVFGLVLLAARGRRILATVTAFTLGHSVTLCLAALGYAQLPSAPIELLIALTILYLAVELAGNPQRRSWARRRPWIMAASFGLLHGLGFAGALREVGLPQGDVVTALLSFNVGIEVGQLAFVALLLVVAAGLRPRLAQLPPIAVRLPIEVMGGLAGYWCIERLTAL